jgi:hypothetical protein
MINLSVYPKVNKVSNSVLKQPPIYFRYRIIVSKYDGNYNNNNNTNYQVPSILVIHNR